MSGALQDLRAGGKAALARALARLEAAPESEAARALLDEAWASQSGHALGLTGPPGVGKSTLIDALIRALRAQGRRVAVIAVDPSSRRSGGALLGDRTRVTTDPEDDGVFIRSMAARERLGGIAAMTFPALVVMRALYDVVIVETVGVGQSETEIADIADTVAFCAQPGSGDALQFMKAGVMEIPHIALVTKADMGQPARRAVADLKGALSLAGGEAEPAQVLSLSARSGEGVEAFVDALAARFAHMAETGALQAARGAQLTAWARRALFEGFGAEGLARIDDSLVRLEDEKSPFAIVDSSRLRLRRALAVGLAQH